MSVREEDKTTKITVRLPKELCESIDADLLQGMIKKSRNTWVQEAILEKLRRGGESGNSSSES